MQQDAAHRPTGAATGRDHDGAIGRVQLEYDDMVLYGWRKFAIERKAIESGRFGAASECAIFAVGCPNDAREFWNMSHLQGNDRRIKEMMGHLKFNHSMPIQRFSWPKIEHSQFPLLCVSSTMTGKTYTHLLYIVTKIINAIPISKVNELANELKSFKPLAELPANGQNGTSKPVDWTTIEEVNQDEIDFDGAFGEKIDELDNAQEKEANEQDDIDVDQFISHPKYIIISSSQQQVEFLDRQFEQVKSCLYPEATSSRIKMMPPIVKTVSVHHNEEKLALKCTMADVLIASPAALMKCVHLKYITFERCKKLFFDDLDLTLQLHHTNAREIIKLYLENLMYFENGSVDGGENNKQQSLLNACRLYLFSKKWTDLVKRVVAVFPQRTIIFGSLAEASLYANVKYEIETCPDAQSKLKKLTDLLDHVSGKFKIAIVCNSDKEAASLNEFLKTKEFEAELMTQANSNQSTRQQQRSEAKKNKICILSDQSIDVLLDINPHISMMGCLIHFSMPNCWDKLDQRFRLIHNKISEQDKEVTTTMLIEPNIDQKLAKELLDLVSRSLVTQNSSKLALRDLVDDRQDAICWRWASTGVCRLERLTPGVRFGSYCGDRHHIKPEDDMKNLLNVPLQNGGQFKITITHIISPTEFYFRFESYRNLDNKNWTSFEKISGAPMRALQRELNRYRSVKKYSLPLEQLIPGKIYGIYFPQEVRVDRIRLLEAPQIDMDDSQHAQYLNQFNRQVQVVCIDSGKRLCVTIGNIFRLPEELVSNWEPMAYRGFHLGYKPTDNEPNWLYKAKRHFFEQVCLENMIDCTVWLRHANEGCFWFEDMVVNRWLANLDGTEIVKTRPHKDLIKAGFAAEVPGEPAGIGPSLRSRIVSKWQLEEATREASYAFLRSDRQMINIYILDVYRCGVEKRSLELAVRNADYNKQVIELENDMLSDYKKDKMERLNYFEVGAYCLAKIVAATTETAEGFDMNRCQIVRVFASDLNATGEELYEVECLDHADRFVVRRSDLYLPLVEHIRRLPFQAIRCKLANVDPAIVGDEAKFERARELVLKYTRSVDNIMVTCICERNLEDKERLDLMIPVSAHLHLPLRLLLEENKEMQLFLS